MMTPRILTLDRLWREVKTYPPEASRNDTGTAFLRMVIGHASLLLARPASQDAFARRASKTGK